MAGLTFTLHELATISVAVEELAKEYNSLLDITPAEVLQRRSDTIADTLEDCRSILDKILGLAVR